MRAQAWFLWCVASLFAACRASETVDALTDPQRWIISGTQAYPAQLADKATIWQRSFPSSSRADFIAFLQQVLLEGYRKDGFLESQVNVRVVADDGGRIICTINDGPGSVAARSWCIGVASPQ